MEPGPSASLTLVVGGAASGKSRFALDLADRGAAGRKARAFLATAEPLDEEMRDKVRRHQASRGSSWETVEVPHRLAEWFLEKAAAYDLVLLDCLTLWVSNGVGTGLGEEELMDRASGLIQAVRQSGVRTIMVTNELGLGLVPMESSGRRFRELAGRVNQHVAAAADDVFFVVCGIPMRIKP